ncbi:DUF4466 family protein [Coprobacter sp.]
MKTMYFRKFSILSVLCWVSLLFISCNDDYEIPDSVTKLSSDCIKRSLGPNVVGGQIEFAYAMALPKEKGKLVAARVEASIAGAEGTYLEHRSFHTDNVGSDVGVEVGSPSETNGTVTEVRFTVDTCASTLRYYYVVPEEARGKEVSFVFFAESSNGETAKYKMGSYKIAEMDMKLDIKLNNNTYFSIEDMKTYTAAEAAEHPEKIDLVYLFRMKRGIKFLHALVAPTADADYLPNITLPNGLTNNTKIKKVYSSCDQQLARNEAGVFVDDLDLQQIDLSRSPNYTVALAKMNGVWIETADGRYRAYIYINEAKETSAGITISMKRLKVR